ncbi:solute carrier organic anion transporter family member 74D [Onthophagus taurus]|uniref:solute carrier organic anion transporter family member 74D n=1 Tax=Onthophagus taurus TaxID=166361 RepID=UPI000C200953|nr:solute carrier organic anion transporter family member 5A1 [Onthophagus taurus]
MDANHKDNGNSDYILPEEEVVLKSVSVEIDEDTTCGLWFIKGKLLQKFANKKAFVFLYGILGCLFSATYAYYNGTITTLEQRFKIPSKTTGIITVGNDLSQLLVSVILSYYVGRRHRPRWMAIGLYTVVLFCLLTALPHWLYGAGKDALFLTIEYGQMDNNNTDKVFELEKKKVLCGINQTLTECDMEEGNYAPATAILFTAQLISGIGSPLYYTLGISYMDDNIRKSKTPALISISYFLRTLGPAIGYALASICLKLYISPSLTPTINNNDPRWLGAWWLGWIILAGIIFLCASLLALFPKQLPRAAARKLTTRSTTDEPELPRSFKDMMKTFNRLVKNPTLMLNNFAAVFYFLGYMPYWIFLPKYIETLYKQSASASSLITGTAGLIFSAIGVLLSGLIISKFKPTARILAAWNVVVGAISVFGIISYVYLDCLDINPIAKRYQSTNSCNSNCNCDYVKYNPVCSQDGKTSFISACHAGCSQYSLTNLTKLYKECSCIQSDDGYGYATSGNCHVDCFSKFYAFLAVVCLLKFTGATGRVSNFLVTVRCVEEKDKPVAMGFALMMMSLCAFVPSPILFGIILDKACLVWGKTCSGNGNCWLYNSETLRYTLNFTAAGFVTIGTIFDVGVWYFVKGLKIFDDDVEFELKDI